MTKFKDRFMIGPDRFESHYNSGGIVRLPFFHVKTIKIEQERERERERERDANEHCKFAELFVPASLFVLYPIFLLFQSEENSLPDAKYYVI